MPSKGIFKAAAEHLNNVLYLDSKITIDQKLLIAAMQKDGVVPDRGSIDVLVMGNDEGVVPDELTERYPHLSALLDDQF